MDTTDKCILLLVFVVALVALCLLVGWKVAALIVFGWVFLVKPVVQAWMESL
jgi:hypothetical protein